jgi:hypothetical protein
VRLALLPASYVDARVVLYVDPTEMGRLPVAVADAALLAVAMLTWADQVRLFGGAADPDDHKQATAEVWELLERVRATTIGTTSSPCAVVASGSE